MNERERRTDRRLAELEAAVFGEAKGPDGTVAGRRQGAKVSSGPAPYVPPRDNRGQMTPHVPGEKLKALKARRAPEAAVAPPDPGLPDLNTATVEELQAVNGIGKATAERIIVHRKDEPFKAVDDLERVGGISAGVIAKIRDHVTVGNG